MSSDDPIVSWVEVTTPRCAQVVLKRPRHTKWIVSFGEHPKTLTQRALDAGTTSAVGEGPLRTLAGRHERDSIARMHNRELPLLLDQILSMLSDAETPANIDIEQALVEMGCAPGRAELLADYLPAACGRAFLREIDVTPSDTYRRPNPDGSWGPPTPFADDPLWTDVEAFVETIRTDPKRRKQFGVAARLSAECDAINNAVNSGKSLAEMAGSSFASVFAAPLRRRS